VQTAVKVKCRFSWNYYNLEEEFFVFIAVVRPSTAQSSVIAFGPQRTSTVKLGLLFLRAFLSRLYGDFLLSNSNSLVTNARIPDSGYIKFGAL